MQLTPVSIRLGFGRVSARVDKEIADLSVAELKTVQTIDVSKHRQIKREPITLMVKFRTEDLTELSRDSPVRLIALVAAEVRSAGEAHRRPRTDSRTPEPGGDALTDTLTMISDTAASGPTGNPLTALSAAHASVKMANTEDRLGVEGFLTDATRTPSG